MSAAIVTIITRSHLPFARVLMKSASRWVPQAARFAILADQPGSYLDPAESFQVIPSEDLPIEGSRWFHFKYSAMELSMALKPHAMRFLFQEHGFTEIVYLDSDIRIFSDLDELLEITASHSVTVTPHLTSPLCDGHSPNDLDILRSGIYNGGFLALHQCAETVAFLEWWASRLQDHCLVDFPNGLFVDQRWLDFVPAFYPHCCILRAPEYNAAYWNLGERRIERQSDRDARQYVVNGQPLRFFHYSGFDPNHPAILSKHDNRHTSSNINECVRALFLDYSKELLENGYNECHKSPNAYASFANGVPIPDAARNVFYEAPGLCSLIDDPFSDKGYEILSRYWQEGAGSQEKPRVTDLGYSGRGSASRGVRPSLPKIAVAIYESRPDVQKAFPDPGGRDRVKFLAWMLTAGQVEHSVSREFLEPVWRAWKQALAGLSPFERARHRIARFAMSQSAKRWTVE